MPTARELQAAVYGHAGMREWDKVEAMMHEDFVLYEAECLPFGGEWKGKDALQRCFGAMASTWADIAVDIHDITGGENWAVTVLTLTMTSKVTGNTFSQTVCEAGTFEDGLMTSLRIHYFDSDEVAREAKGEAAA